MKLHLHIERVVVDAAFAGEVAHLEADLAAELTRLLLGSAGVLGTGGAPGTGGANAHGAGKDGASRNVAGRYGAATNGADTSAADGTSGAAWAARLVAGVYIQAPPATLDAGCGALGQRLGQAVFAQLRGMVAAPTSAHAPGAAPPAAARPPAHASQ